MIILNFQIHPIRCGSTLKALVPIHDPIEVIDGASDLLFALVEDARINHCGIYVFVSEQFLDRANVAAGFQHMNGEAMAERLATARFGNSGSANCFFHGSLQDGFVSVETGKGAGWVKKVLVTK